MARAFKQKWKSYLVAGLLVANIFVWVEISRSHSNFLEVHFLDVGQGEAILVEGPSGAKILIDGGKNRQALSELGKIMRFGDRTIDILIATHPDLDHIGGLPEVVERYKVGAYLEPEVNTMSEVDLVLEKRLLEKAVPKLYARRGIVINLGRDAKLSILFPNQDVSSWDTNDASVIAKLTYGEHSFLFTGDAELKTEVLLNELDKDRLKATVLKAGHHGSRTSTHTFFASLVSPEYAVISAGKDNTYGHPHQEVLANLASVGAVTFSTAERGTISFRTNGENLKIK